jgi:hypothetical protein
VLGLGIDEDMAHFVGDGPPRRRQDLDIAEKGNVFILTAHSEINNYDKSPNQQ